MLGRFKAELLGAAIVFFVSLIVYTWTLAPTVTLVDSGELIVAAHSLGVAHPPGFPLYLLLAHIASLIPFGSLAVRVNFASAFFAALACAMLTLVAAEFATMPSLVADLKWRPRKGARKDKVSRSGVRTSAKRNSLLTIIPAACAGLLMAFSRTLWSYATIAEVYTLNTFLFVAILFLILCWRRCILEDERFGSTKPTITDYDWMLYAAAIVFGLALGVHHVSIALLLPALAVIVCDTQGLKFFVSKRLLYAALVSVAALVIVYSYLPWAASGSPILNWGNPNSLWAIWWHITGRQYQTFLSFSPQIAGEEFVKFVSLVLREFGPRWLPLALGVAIIGFISAFKRDRTAFWFLILIVAANLTYALAYEIAEDKDAYCLPTFICIAIAVGFGLRAVFERIAPRLLRYATMSMFLIPAIAVIANWPFNNRSHYFIARDYVENIQSTIEPNGLLLTMDWQVASPMLYTREIEQRRQDIKVVDVQLLRRSWYCDYLRRSYPAFIERSRYKVNAYLVQLKQWENNPQAYKKSGALTREISFAFQQLMQSFVSRELEVAPVYVTAELILLKQGPEVDLIQWLNKYFQAFPRGLVFQLTRDSEFHDPGDPHLQTRGLVDGTIQFAEDDVVKIKVLTVYKAMIQSRGQYLAHFNQQERAAAAFAEARRFDANPNLSRKDRH